MIGKTTTPGLCVGFEQTNKQTNKQTRLNPCSCVRPLLSPVATLLENSLRSNFVLINLFSTRSAPNLTLSKIQWWLVSFSYVFCVKYCLVCVLSSWFLSP